MNKGLIFGGIGIAAAVAAAGVYFAVSGGGSAPGGAQAKAQVDEWLASFKAQGGDSQYKAVESQGKAVIIRDSVVKPPKGGAKVSEVRIGEVRFHDWDWKNSKSPTYGDVEYKKITFGGIDDAKVKEFMAGAELKELVLNGRAAFKLDAGNKAIDLSRASVEVEGVGTLSLSLKLDGADLDAFKGLQTGATPDLGKLMGSVMALRLHGAAIGFADAGGFARLIKVAALSEKTTEAAVREKMTQQLKGAQAMAPKSKLTTEAFAAFESFLKKPGTLEIKAAPSSPVAFLQLATFGAPTPESLDKLKDTLGLSIVAK